MTLASTIAAADPRTIRRGVPRALVVGWLAVFAGLEWLLQKGGLPFDVGLLLRTLTVVECVEIAVLARLFGTFKDSSDRMTAAEALATLAALAAVVLVVSRSAILAAPIAGGSLIALYILCRFARSPAHRAFAIALCLFFSQYAFSAGPLIWLHTLVGTFDATMARELLKAAGLEVGGAGSLIIRPSQNFAVDVSYGCSTSYVVGLAVPGFLIMVLGLRRSFRAMDAAYLAALIFIILIFNWARLTVIAVGPAMYEFWHQGLGASLYSALDAVLILAAAFAATRAHRAVSA